jgi:hypothetical protein
MNKRKILFMLKLNEEVQWFMSKRHWFNPIPIEILYKLEVVVNLRVSWWIYIYIYIYIYESSFYQVGACLQVESCFEGWIPHISVGSEINKSGLVMRVGFLISQLDMRNTS